MPSNSPTSQQFRPLDDECFIIIPVRDLFVGEVIEVGFGNSVTVRDSMAE